VAHQGLYGRVRKPVTFFFFCARIFQELLRQQHDVAAALAQRRRTTWMILIGNKGRGGIFGLDSLSSGRLVAVISRTLILRVRVSPRA
jgi:hypothetical protein